MPVSVRPASVMDRRGMAKIMGVDPAELGAWMDDNSAYSAWHLAETDEGECVGVQRIGPGPDFEPGICEIATFVSAKSDTLRIGSRLFEATAPIARDLGFSFIDARFDASNEGARIYYQSRGFRFAAQSETETLLRYEID